MMILENYLSLRTFFDVYLYVFVFPRIFLESMPISTINKKKKKQIRF